MVPQPRRAARAGRTRHDLRDAAPVGARRAAELDRRRTWSPSDRGWSCTRAAAGGSPAAALRRRRASGICSATVAATTSSHVPRSRTSRCWRRPRRRRGRLRAGRGLARGVGASYWRDYLGPIGGGVGHLVQRACAHSAASILLLAAARRAAAGRGTARRGHRAARRLRRLDEPTTRRGQRSAGGLRRAVDPREARAAWSWPVVAGRTAHAGPAGNHLRRRAGHASALHAAIAARERATRQRPRLRGLGGGPSTRPAPRLCVLAPSRREGYGMVVVEASARATPSIVIAGADNAAIELRRRGVNG